MRFVVIVLLTVSVLTGAADARVYAPVGGLSSLRNVQQPVYRSAGDAVAATPVLDMETRGRRLQRYPEPSGKNKGGYKNCRELSRTRYAPSCQYEPTFCTAIRYGCEVEVAPGQKLLVMYVEVRGRCC